MGVGTANTKRCFLILFSSPLNFAMSALVFTVLGASYGTAKSGVGISSMGVMKPELVMRAIIPVIFAGVIGIYGLIVAVIISGHIDPTKNYPLLQSFLDLGAGLAVGMAIGIVGDAGVRATAQQPRLYVGMVLILIFSEALALYGLIVAIILAGKNDTNC